MSCPRSDSEDPRPDPFACFHPVTAEWFRAVFDAPTAPQRLGWPVIARGESALILAPTGTGKTLTAFLWCLDRLMLHCPRADETDEGCTASSTSRPSKPWPSTSSATCAHLWPASPTWPAAGRSLPRTAHQRPHRRHPAARARPLPPPSRRHPHHHARSRSICLLTSQAAEALRTVDTVIIDEIHALVPTKRGAHLALSLERLEARRSTNGLFSASASLLRSGRSKKSRGFLGRCGNRCGKGDREGTN